MKRLVIAATLLAALVGAVLPAGAACDGEGPDADVAPTKLIGAASPSPTAPTFTQVSAGSFHTCGVKTDGTVACWGDNKYEQATPPAGSFTQVSAGDLHTCGVKTDGSLACWPWQVTPPAGSFTQVSLGGDNSPGHTCGVKTDGTVACSGDNEYGQATPPAGSFTQVSAGGFHTCGVKTDGTVVCWGDNEDGQATPPTASQTAAWSATSPVGRTSPTWGR